MRLLCTSEVRLNNVEALNAEFRVRRPLSLIFAANIYDQLTIEYIATHRDMLIISKWISSYSLMNRHTRYTKRLSVMFHRKTSVLIRIFIFQHVQRV